MTNTIVIIGEISAFIFGFCLGYKTKENKQK